MEKEEAITEIEKILKLYRPSPGTGFNIKGKGAVIINSISVGHETGFDISGKDFRGKGLRSFSFSHDQTSLVNKIIQELKKEEPEKSTISKLADIVKGWGPIGLGIIRTLIALGYID